LSKRQWLRDLLLLFWCNWQGGSQGSRGWRLMRLGNWVSKSSLHLTHGLLLGRFFTFLNIWQLILLQNRVQIWLRSFVALPGVFSGLRLSSLLNWCDSSLYLTLRSLVDIHILCLIQRLFLSVLGSFSRRNQLIQVIVGNLCHWVRLNFWGSLSSWIIWMKLKLLRAVELIVSSVKTLVHHLLSLLVLLEILL
jgi:hypothetical protein